MEEEVFNELTPENKEIPLLKINFALCNDDLLRLFIFFFFNFTRKNVTLKVFQSLIYKLSYVHISLKIAIIMYKNKQSRFIFFLFYVFIHIILFYISPLTHVKERHFIFTLQRTEHLCIALHLYTDTK